MASESSLLLRWHPAYRTSASGIPLKMVRHPAYQKGCFTLLPCEDRRSYIRDTSTLWHTLLWYWFCL